MIVSLSFLSSCQKKNVVTDTVNSLTEFDMPYTTTLAVPPQSVITNNTYTNQSPPFATNSASVYSNYKTSTDLITSMAMTQVNLTTDGPNLDFVKSYSIYIQATGLEDALVASKSNIPVGSKSIESDVTNVNLIPYINKDKISLMMVSSGGGTVAGQTLTLKTNAHAKATLIK